MGQRIVRSSGFEEGLAALIAASFRFSDDTLKLKPLEEGRHLFVDELPEVEDVETTSPEFQPDVEPTIGLYSRSGQGPLPTSSSGSRHEFQVDILLRFGRSMSSTKRLLGQLFDWLLKKAQGKAAGDFRIRAVLSVQRPVPFQRFGDDHAVASSSIRFLVVPIR